MRCSSGASHHEVVTRRSCNKPAAWSRNTDEHDAATAPPRKPWRLTASIARAASTLARRCAKAAGRSTPRPGMIQVEASARERTGSATASARRPPLSGTPLPLGDITRHVGRGIFARGASAAAAFRMSSVTATPVAQAPGRTRTVKSCMTKNA